jgi:hypothetical protein
MRGQARRERQEIAIEARRAEDGTVDVLAVDAGESPLAWLGRRRGRDGRPMLEADQVMAGERLRADYTFGGLLPRITVDWSAFGGAGRGTRRPAGDAADLAEATLAARDRVGRALAAVGPELAGVLVDVCCFLKGLEAVERERGWPARSAKIVLGLALDRLAVHYGIGRKAVGPDRSRGIRHAGTPDYRPNIA